MIKIIWSKFVFAVHKKRVKLSQVTFPRTLICSLISLSMIFLNKKVTSFS